MDPERFKQIRKLFVEALQHDVETRSAFLDTACEGDPDLRRELEELIALDGEDDGFLETPATTGLPPGLTGLDLTGKRIGQYHLRSVISSGGMGTVYEAEQEHPRRTVAVKVMKQQVVSVAAMRRFEYEAQILARLKHPNIAQVIEAGTHFLGEDESGGVPFFVMEFIPHARSLSEYVREENLLVKERLSLFRQVCDAVHHGHQRGIIHRDLKPSNILVDAKGTVKVIDFGVARATDSDMALTTIETELGQLIGTLQYMSPEQCMADPHDLDIRSDVYSLGVVLYEVLCGALPYDVRKAAVFEATRLIREEPPKRPSTVDRLLRGDVETIVLKALEKERRQRYQTVADLGEDIHRHLNGEVILARPAGLLYRLWKQIKRNPMLSSAVGAVVLCVVCFSLYVVLWLYPRLEEEKDKLAQEMGNTRMINSFLEEMLSWADPFKEGRELKVAEMLDRAAERIDREFPDRPGIEASLRNTLGSTYMSNGRYDAAQKQLEKAVELFSEIAGIDHPDTLRARDDMALLYWQMGLYEKAEPLFLETLADMQRMLGEDHEGTLGTQHNLGALYSSQGRYDEAESRFLDTLKALRRILPEGHENISRTMASLSSLYQVLGRYEEAERISLDVLAARRRNLGYTHPLTISKMNDLALLYYSQGKYDKAEPLYRSALEGGRLALGPEHPNVLITMTNLASLCKEMARFEEAEILYRSTLELQRRVLGDEHPQTLLTIHNLGSLSERQAKVKEAEQYYAEALEAEMHVLGKDHTQTIASMNGLANVYANQGRFDEAEALYRDALEGNRHALGDDHPTTQSAIHNLGVLYCNHGEFDKALPFFEEALEGKKKSVGNDHPETLMTGHNLACLYFRQKKYDDAATLFTEVLEARRRVLGDDHIATLETMNNLGGLHYYQGRHEEAEATLVECLERRRRLWGDDHPNTLSTLRSLANILKNQGRYAEAEPLARELVERTPEDSNDYERNKTILDQIQEKLNADESEGADEVGGENESKK